MVAIPIRIHIRVDPCGRVLVGEVEKLAPGEGHGYLIGPDGKIAVDEEGNMKRDGLRPPDYWYHHPACVVHVVDVMVPVPTITTPQIEFRTEPRKPLRSGEQLDD